MPSKRIRWDEARCLAQKFLAAAVPAASNIAVFSLDPKSGGWPTRRRGRPITISGEKELASRQRDGLMSFRRQGE